MNKRMDLVKALSNNASKRIKNAALVFLCITALLGCSTDPDDDGGVIGTGIILRGTVNETALASTDSVSIRSADGQRAAIQYEFDGDFSSNQLPGIGPWLLRVQLNQDRFIYGIAYAEGTRNINSFSDISLRRWFALEGLNLDQIFESDGRIERLPSSTEYDASVTSIFILIDLVLASYEISGNDVINTRYTSNDTGIDAFLNRNSVVLEDGLITFRLTDPDTEIQSETATPVDISNDLVESGVPPTVPGSIRAVASDNDEIILAWEPSVDDVSVIGYVVVRDETLLGTTPYPQFVDAGVEENRSYTYLIVAIDGAGNSSDPSIPTMGSLNLTLDTVAPAAPAQLSQLSASNTAIRLSWSASSSTDVAIYRVHRNELTTGSVPIQDVSITRSTDTDIRLDETYCYQVSAIDGSGNESELSNEICSSADGGITMEVPSTSPAPVPIGAQTVSDWTIVDVDALDCTSTLTNADISVGRLEISNECYTVPETLDIEAGSTLQLGQGAVLRFASGADLLVSGGSLTAIGSKDNPVILTGLVNTPGSWGGVAFLGNSADNILDGVVVQYGGASRQLRAAVSTAFDGARFRMLNTLVFRNDDAALLFTSLGVRIDAFSGNLIQENGNVGAVIATAVSSMGGSNDYIENVVNELTIFDTLFENEDIVIPSLGIPISLGGLELENGSLTIQPGTDIEMVGAGRIVIHGEFNANGTAVSPIVFRGRSQSTGIWDGILLSGPGDKDFDHVSIIGGGLSGNTGAIEVDCNQGESFAVNVNNTTISGSDGWGLYAEGDDCTYNISPTVTFSNNTLGDINIP